MTATQVSDVRTPVRNAVSSEPLADDRAGAEAPAWAMLVRTGTWLGHPTVPEVVTPERLRSAADYFARHYAAHGVDLVIDYHHASVLAPRQGTRAPAAGWVTGMELRAGDTELWGCVTWTTEAANALARREYRYLSPVLRFDAPDRVTGEAVPMAVHSVALTNTPFLTELPGLNETAASDGGRAVADGGETGHGPHAANGPSSEGGASMSLLDSLAEALEAEPEQVASQLGLEGAEADGQVAAALVRNADRVRRTAEALGLEPDAEPTAWGAALIRLKAPSAGLQALSARLGLDPDADETDILNAVDALRDARRRDEAEALVDEAVNAGCIPPAHREFYLREARNDLAAARAVINSLPVLLPADVRPSRAARQDGSRGLTDEEESVCRQLGLAAHAFLQAAAR